MDIITRPEEAVNVFLGIPSILSHKIAEESERWEVHKIRCSAVSARLAAIGQHARAYRMEHCAEDLVYRWCRSCGSRHIISASLCRDRFCPVCKWRLSLKRFSVMCQIVQGLRREYARSAWQFVTLTVENCAPGDLRETMDEMLSAWDKIMKRRTTRRALLGWARSIEVTYNAKTKMLHPHFHVLLLWAEDEEPNDLIINAWLETVSIRAVHKAQHAEVIHSLSSGLDSSDSPEELTGAVLETFKYSVKDADLQEMPLRLFKELDKEMRGRRMVAFGGKVKEYARALNAEVLMEEASEEEDEDELNKCVSCGSLRVIEVVGRWTGDGYLWRRAERF